MVKIEKKEPESLQSKAGKACYKKHGKEFYQKIVAKRWKNYRAKQRLESKEKK